MAKKRVHRPEGYASSGSTKPAPRTVAGSPKVQGSFPATSRRARFENASRPWLARMQRLPNFVVPMALAVMLFLGLALPWNWAGILLVLIGVFLAWLTALSWPVISPASRALRVVANLAVVGLGVMRLTGRL